MQDADADGRVHVLMRLLFFMRFGGTMAVCVDMRVPLAVVVVLMDVHVALERLVQSPQANAKQHHAHETLTPGRQ